MNTYYDFKVDTADNGSFAYNARVDVSGVDWVRGREDRIGIADVGVLNVTLNSEDGRYFLRHANRVSGWAIGRKALLQGVANGVREGLFKGVIRDVRTILSPVGKPFQVQVVVQDMTSILAENPISIPGQRPLPFDGLVNALLDAAAWSGPRYIWTQGEYAEYATVDDQTPYQALSDIVQAEGGIFFVDRSGVARYLGHRWRDAFRQSASVDISSMIEDATPLSPDVVTEVIVTVNPMIDFGPEQIYDRSGFQLKATPKNSKEFWIDSSEMISAWKEPKKDLDYRAKIADGKAPPNKQGDRVDEWLNVWLTDQSTYRAKVHVVSSGGSKNYTVSVIRLFVRGTIFRAADPIRLVFSGVHLPVSSGGVPLPRAFYNAEAGAGAGVAGRKPAVRGARVGGDNVVGSRLGLPTAKAGTVSGLPVDALGGYRSSTYFRNPYEVNSRFVTQEAFGRSLGEYLRKLLSYPVPDLEVKIRAGTDEDILKVFRMDVWDRVHVTLPDQGIDEDYSIERIKVEDRDDDAILTAMLYLSPVVPGTSKVGTARVAPWPALDFMSFDGVDDYVDLGDILDQAGSFTAEAWVRVNSLTTANFVVTKDNATNGWNLQVQTNGSVRFITRGLSNVTLDSSAGIVTVGTWVHLAAVWDLIAKTKTIYVNGVQVAQATGVTGSIADTAGSLQIGARSGLSTARMKGAIGEARLWSVARSAEDIDRFRAAVLDADDEPDLVGYWPLNEEAGTVAYGWGDPGTDGTINGDPVRVDEDFAIVEA